MGVVTLFVSTSRTATLGPPVASASLEPSGLDTATAGRPAVAVSSPLGSSDAEATGGPRVAVLLVDTKRVMASIDQRISGHFLEHINHSVEDGLFAEQIQGLSLIHISE